MHNATILRDQKHRARDQPADRSADQRIGGRDAAREARLGDSSCYGAGSCTGAAEAEREQETGGEEARQTDHLQELS
jgi:hypothetical protein